MATNPITAEAFLLAPQTFKERAATMLELGIPVIPLTPHSKNPWTAHAAKDATLDPAQIDKWAAERPASNCGAVARHGEKWFLDDDGGALAATLEAQGKTMPVTFTVKTSRGYHFYFLHDASSNAVRYGSSENSGVIKVNGFKGEARCNNQYVVAPGSIHPSGALYEIFEDAPIVAAPQWLLDWLQAAYDATHLKGNSTEAAPAVPLTGGLIVGGRHEDPGFKRLSEAVGSKPMVRRMNASANQHFQISELLPGQTVPCPMPKHIHQDYTPCFGVLMENPLMFKCLGNCGFAGDITKAVFEFDGNYTVMYDAARQICKEEGLKFEDYFETTPTVPRAEIPKVETIEVQSREVTESNADNSIPDMSDAVLDGRLGEIYQRRLSPTRNECGFPISYGWTALTTVAGVMVPRIDGGLIVEAPRTNLYVVQIGAVHSGKSVVINRAVSVLGLPNRMYSDLKSGSAEGLLKKLNKEFEKGRRTGRLLQDLDEWKHYFRKAEIESASFMTVLNTGFYKDHYNLAIAGGYEIDFDCSISWIGGVVQEEYGDVIGAAATGGFYDRLYQGVCPSGFSFDYFPYEGVQEEVTPQSVRIDGSVWEVVREWRKADPSIGRAAEVAIRVAHICASYDGRPVLRGEDLRPAKALLDEQLKVRKLCAPGVGETLDAKCSAAIMKWMHRVASAGEWVDIRDLQRGINYDRFGAVMFNRCLQALSHQFGGELDITVVRGKSGAGRPKAAVRLAL